MSATSRCSSTSVPRAYVRQRSRPAREIVATQRRSKSCTSYFTDQLFAVAEERDSSVYYGMQLLRRLKVERREAGKREEDHSTEVSALTTRISDVTRERKQATSRHSELHSKNVALMAERDYFIEGLRDRDEEIARMQEQLDVLRAKDIIQEAAPIADSPPKVEKEAPRSPPYYPFFDGMKTETETTSVGVQVVVKGRTRTTQTDAVDEEDWAVHRRAVHCEECDTPCDTAEVRQTCLVCANAVVLLRERLATEKLRCSRLERRLDEMEATSGAVSTPLSEGTPTLNLNSSLRWEVGSGPKFSPAQLSGGVAQMSLEDELRLLDDYDNTVRSEQSCRSEVDALERTAFTVICQEKKAALTGLLLKVQLHSDETHARTSVENAESVSRSLMDAQSVRATLFTHSAESAVKQISTTIDEEKDGRVSLEELEADSWGVIASSVKTTQETSTALRMANRTMQRLCKEIKTRETGELLRISTQLDWCVSEEASQRATIVEVEAEMSASWDSPLAFMRRESSVATTQITQQRTRQTIERQHRRIVTEAQHQKEATMSLERVEGYSRTNVEMKEVADREQLHELLREQEDKMREALREEAAKARAEREKLAQLPTTLVNERCPSAPRSETSSVQTASKQQDPQFISRMMRLGVKKAQQAQKKDARQTTTRATTTRTKVRSLSASSTVQGGLAAGNRATSRAAASVIASASARRRSLSSGVLTNGGTAVGLLSHRQARGASMSSEAHRSSRNDAGTTPKARSVSVGAERSPQTVPGITGMPNGQWADEILDIPNDMEPLLPPRRSVSVPYTDGSYASPQGRLSCTNCRTPLHQKRGRSYSSHCGSVTPSHSSQVPIQHWAFDYEVGKEWTQLRETVLHADSSMALKIAQIKESKDKEGIFKVAHQSLKVVLATAVHDRTLQPGEVWKLHPEEIEGIPRHQRAQVLRALRDIVCAYDMMRETQKASLLTVQEIRANVPSLILLARWSQQGRYSSIGRSSSPPTTPSYLSRARSTSPSLSIGRLSTYSAHVYTN